MKVQKMTASKNSGFCKTTQEESKKNSRNVKYLANFFKTTDWGEAPLLHILFI